MVSRVRNLSELPISERPLRAYTKKLLVELEHAERRYFEALVDACDGTCSPLEDDGRPGGHPDFEVTFGDIRISCELKCVYDDMVTQHRNKLRDMITRRLIKRSANLWIMADGRWRNWIESDQIDRYSRVADAVATASIRGSRDLPDTPNGELVQTSIKFDFGTVRLSIMREYEPVVNVSEGEPNRLSKRIREVLGKARLQHKTSRLRRLPLVIVLFLRDTFDDISRVGVALLGDYSYRLERKEPGAALQIDPSLDRTNRFYAPHKNTSVSAVLYVPCGTNWSDSPVTLIPNPFARVPVQDSWFAHPDIARQEIDLS